MKQTILPYLARMISSDEFLTLQRQCFAVPRRILQRQETPTLDVFLKVDDPYSFLLVQVLEESITDRFDVTFQFHVFQEIDPDMYPRLDMWKEYAGYDARRLAELYDLTFPKPTTPAVFLHDPQERILQLALSLVNHERDENFLSIAKQSLTQFWFHSEEVTNKDSVRIDKKEEEKLRYQLAENEKLLKQKGHYLGAMIYMEGEWYWGIDRLDHLERRLIDSGFSKKPNETVHFNRTYEGFCQGSKTIGSPKRVNAKSIITLYWSARSPYSYIGLERTIQLAHHYDVPLDIKPVLPMVMRGMKVPTTKKMYIFHDTKREAKKLGLPYGFVADPLGDAVERCYALVDYARNEKKLEAFLLSFARGVNAEGIRAETDRGMKTIVERSGLKWDVAKSRLADRSWEQWAQTNLKEMISMGCWGVPSIRYDDMHFWGQDRIGLLENYIRNASE